MTAKHLDVIFLRHAQHGTGAYPACPTFSQYPHSWLRDGSFIAHAMDRVGAHASARAFHLWVNRTLEPLIPHVEGLLRRVAAGEPVKPAEMLPARFSIEGEWLRDGWPNFQLDGYGQWLWSLREHLRLTGEPGLPEALQPVVRAVANYLAAFWRTPCSDCWEEFHDRLHTATLASIHGGLRAASEYLGGLEATADEIRAFILDCCVQDGRFVKSVGKPAVDASLVWVSTPFGVVPPEHPAMRATVEEIERTLVRDGGVIRYAEDEYFGAGAWLLLTDFLAWHLARDGQSQRAARYVEWAEAHRDAWGHLPEQVPVSTTDPARLKHWTGQWGPSASPLLWSHAMHLIARDELG